MSTDPTSTPSSRHRLLYVGHPESHVPGYELPEIASPRLKPWQLVVTLVAGLAVAWVGFAMHHWASEPEAREVSLLWVAPFALLLASIATMPFIAKHFWEHNYGKVAVALGLIVVVYYGFFITDGAKNIAASLAEYVSFIFLLASLFVVSGGILIRVRARATPLANVVMLLVGAIIANVFGTTGASMLLIRPFLRMNAGHLRPYHVVFFIFIVSNAGGSLTPIGDPPLFLGYLMGVPFWWVLEHCWPIWATVCGLLAAIFFVVDTLHARKDDRAHYTGVDRGPVVTFYGASNLFFIALILAGILLHDTINHWTHARLGFEAPWREMTMALAAVASLAMTPARVHGENAFNYAPIKEVALLFVGIFLTMTPALNYMYNTSKQSGGLLTTPGQFYFASGTLSSVLDNAPTYKTFLEAELGTLDKQVVDRAIEVAKRNRPAVEQRDVAGLSDAQAAQLRDAYAAMQKYHADHIAAGTVSTQEAEIGLLVGDAKLNAYLIAISMGSVLFGAMTYIGNGPNFMVKSIAEHAGATAPSFFGYLFRFAVPVLLPILIVVWLLFLR
jgi:Na+/H+ antiporter NhaD/arsenite permease-like protein